MEKLQYMDDNGFAGLHDASNLSGENILIGSSGAKCGNIHYVNSEIWLTNPFYSILRRI